ncbi:MAG TPA: T9SS type A sorting domain-containing protein [Adhaeribacter sp.]|nr:T9SS type A sorting domain-containing protein [Adhaeribacter sp.]
MTGSATAKAYAVYAVSGATFGTINYNNYFVDGVNAVFGFLGADVATLAAWRTATTQDANSISVDPQFMSATDLHITTSNLALNNMGTPIAGITTDFDGDVRSTNTPDMGADEFSPASLDLGAFALVSPVTKTCFGAAEPVTVTIKNNGITPVDFTTTNTTLTVTVTVPTGATAPTFPVITLNSNALNGGTPLAVGATLDVPVGTIDMTTPGAYVFNATTNVISGGMDGNTANDAMDATTITVAPLAAGTASAVQASICQSGVTTINLVGNSGGDVQWQSGTSATGPFTDITGATGSSFTLPAAITQTSYYQAIVSCGSNNVTSNVVTLTVNNPLITASAGDIRCGSGTVNLSATPSANATINWYDAATGGVPLATGPTFSPTVSATTTFYAEAFEGGFTTNIGATSNAIGSGAQSTVAHYQLFDVFAPFTLNSVYVYPNAAGNVVIELRNSANAILQTATVAVTAAQIGVKTLIPVNFLIYPGTGYKIGRGSASVSLFRNDGGATYPYTVPGVLSITGSSFNAVSYYWAYDWNISSGCGSARTPVVATVNASPSVALGTDIIQCGNAPVTLDAGNVGATFQWSLNGTPISGATSQTLSATASGTYSVTVTGANTCSGTDDIVVTMNTAAATPTVTATGPTTFCSGGSVALTAASTTTGATYEWFLDGTAITGATSATYTANAAGNYTVVATANGCPSAASSATAVTVNTAAATPTITAAGPTTFCSGGSVALTAASTTTGATYEWFLDGTVITGATSATYTANAAGNYTVVATASGCPSVASAATAVTVNATPATPTITQNGGTLTSSAATGNQWYLNGTAIAGATSQTHVTTTNGAYTLIVTGANTCPSPVSATVNVTNTGVADALAGMSVQVYPNPASGSFNVKLNGYQKEATMVLYNLAGQQITVEKLAADGQAKNINIRGLAAGTYLLKITSDKGVQVSRLLVE